MFTDITLNMKIKKKLNDIRNVPYPARCNFYQSSVRTQVTQIQFQ